MANYNIISFDGGGIKGLLSVILMQRLEREVPGILQKTALFAGTSTGGIIALGLAGGMDLCKLRELYEKKANEIFVRRWQKYFGLTGARYKNEGLKDSLDDIFGLQTLGMLQKKVLIPTFDLKSDDQPYRWKPKFFHNYTPDNCGEFVARVAARTSSAPTYFKATDGYIDGGVAANNPTMCAVSQAINYGAKGIEEIRCLSIGTGVTYRYLDGLNYDFGGLEIGKLVEILIGGVEDVVDYQCKAVLGQKYTRLNPIDKKNTGLDDLDAIPWLAELGGTWPIDGTVAWLKANW